MAVHDGGRRAPLPGAAARTGLDLDTARVIADLRELDRLSGGRRVAWTPEWLEARDFLRSLLPGSAAVSVDSAGNLWALVPGESEEVVAVGSHIDCVPGGGWLDGALGVMAGVELLRSVQSPRRTLALVDWADEEGARFGRSLLGSSAFSGTLDVASAFSLTDSDGVTLSDALASCGVALDQTPCAGRSLAAYLELHIEQGPVLEAEGLSCAAVEGTVGVERCRVVFEGATGHAGTTPMDRRADSAVAAARVIAGLQEIALRHGGVCTAGRLDLSPGIVTAVPGRAELLVDQRHLDPSALSEMLAEASSLWSAQASRENCSVAVEPVFRTEPVRFHDGLVELAAGVCEGGRRLASGALHDATELARVAPTAMVFAPSIRGVSHARGEDTAEADLAAALQAFGTLVERVVADGVPG